MDCKTENNNTQKATKIHIYKMANDDNIKLIIHKNNNTETNNNSNNTKMHREMKTKRAGRRRRRLALEAGSAAGDEIKINEESGLKSLLPIDLSAPSH